ncbi:hypothetical protein OS493_002033 [Desmophyllum pertusum]|uniref:Uncharacterized protein n=1 Tax=Desmophyllum pertusum TaxID=174260 RepID=A0A9X0CTR2_9CNID|nr:hypothetical protein OS493_002033 [Desmophyllum pertusum]
MEQENAKVQEVNKCDHEEEIQEDKRKRTVTEKGESFRLKGLEDERKAAGVALRKQITKAKELTELMEKFHELEFDIDYLTLAEDNDLKELCPSEWSISRKWVLKQSLKDYRDEASDIEQIPSTSNDESADGHVVDILSRYTTSSVCSAERMVSYLASDKTPASEKEEEQINTKKELNYPYCRQPMSDLPLQADETWKKDDYFVTQLKKVWGEIPFWHHNGQYWGRLTLEQTRYGYEKHQVFRRIRMYLSFM